MCGVVEVRDNKTGSADMVIEGSLNALRRRTPSAGIKYIHRFM